jgi:hypothetical protein
MPRLPLAVVAGVLIGLALVAASYGLRAPAPTQVRFDGVALSIAYLNGSSEVFGPTDQNACNETLVIGPGSSLAPECPKVLVEGTAYAVQFFMMGNGGTSPGLWANMTLTAPFNFTVDPGMMGQIPTTYSTSTGLYTGGENELYDQGSYSGIVFEFTMPTGFPSPAQGLWLHAALTVQPTNQTTYPGS